MKQQKEFMRHQSISSTPQFSTLCIYILIISIASSDILWVKVLENQVYSAILQYIYIGLVGIVIFVYYHRNKLTIRANNNLYLFVITILMLFLAAVVREDNINTYLFKIVLIIGGYYGSKLFTFECFYRAFRRIMFVLMMASLLLYFMKLTGVGYAALPVNYIRTGVQYSTIGLANMYNNAFYQIPRAQSVFWESGVYAAYLSILLLFELFCRNEVDKKYIILVLLSMVTTVSTTGYIVMMVIMIAYTITRQTNQSSKKIIAAGLLLVLIVIILVSETMMSELTSKFFNNSESFNNRWLSIGGNLIAIKEAPILGLGPIKSQALIESYIRDQGGKKSLNNLNTVLANYAIFGLLPFVYYIFHLIGFCYSFKINVVGKLLILLSVLFLLSSTGYQFSPFFTLVFMFRISEESNSAKTL